MASREKASFAHLNFFKGNMFYLSNFICKKGYLFSLKGYFKMKILSLITYPHVSKPVKALFVFGTQFKIFWIKKTGRFVTVPLTAK